MTDLFSAEDFDDVPTHDPEAIARTANILVKARARTVYGFGADSDFWQSERDHRYLQYHKALVVCIEPVKETTEQK